MTRLFNKKKQATFKLSLFSLDLSTWKIANIQ